MKQVLIYCLLLSAFALNAQKVHCVVLTKNYDTLVGIGKLKDIIELQIEGFSFFDKNETEQRTLLPSAIKAAWFFSTPFDTLYLVSIPRGFIDQYVDVAKMERSQDTNYLIKTAPGKGPLFLHTVYTGKETRFVPNPNGIGGFNWEKYFSSDFVSLNYKWTRLTELRKERNEDLAKLLADCPALCEKLLKNKYNTVKKLPKVVQLYNQCKQ